MIPNVARTIPDARWLRRTVLLAASTSLVASCNDSNGPRTGKLSLTVGGLPSTVAGQVTLSGPNNYSRTITASDVIANLKPGDYKISAASVRDGATRYSPLADTQSVTITKSNTPVEASVAYAVSS